MQEMQNFSIQHLYRKLRGQFQKMDWRKIACNNHGAPKWLFITVLAAHKRLQTRDRLAVWGITTEKMCPLCDSEEETIDHIFFVCDYSSQIWGKLLLWLKINRTPMSWSNELQWATRHMGGRTPKAEVYRMMLVAAIYYVWQERNQRVFQEKHQIGNCITKRIVQDIHMRAVGNPRLANWLANYDCYPV